MRITVLTSSLLILSMVVLLVFFLIFLYSIECGLYRSSLCGQRGLCKFDLDTHKPHCYCQKGWTGYSCNEQGDNKAEGFTNTTLILAVILILLIFVELGVIMMWDKVKRLRLDPAAYSAFTATADDLAYYCLLYHSSFSNILYF